MRPVPTKSMIKQAHRVLVVDDDASIRESFRKLLQGEGYQVIAVADGLDAMELCCRDRQRFDLLLVDLQMPLKNGWATLDRLLEVDPGLPVFIVTGQPYQYAMAEAAGACALVEKPVDVPALLQTIHDVLAAPASSRHPGSGQRAFPFHILRAAARAPWRFWQDRDFIPHQNGGLNE